MPPVKSIRQSKCLSLLRSYKNHEPIIEPRDIPLPAIRESYLSERKKVVFSGTSFGFRPDKNQNLIRATLRAISARRRARISRLFAFESVR